MVKDIVVPIAAVSTLGIGVAGLALTTIPGLVGVGAVAGSLVVSDAALLTATRIGGLITTGSIAAQTLLLNSLLSQTATKKGY